MSQPGSRGQRELDDDGHRRRRQRPANSAGTGFVVLENGSDREADESEDDRDSRNVFTGSPLSRAWGSLWGSGGGRRQSAQDGPGAGGASPPSFSAQEQSQPRPPRADHWAWRMMGTITTILNVATAIQDQVTRLQANDTNEAPSPTRPAGPRLARPTKPRSPIHNKEQAVIRATLISSWLGGDIENAPPQPDATTLAQFDQQRQVHPHGALPSVNTPRNAILFSSSNKTWNRAMATYFIRHVLTAALNTQVPRPDGPRDLQAHDQRPYFKTLEKRVCDCVVYIFQVKQDGLDAGRRDQRNRQSRDEMARSRLLKQRIAKARSTPWLAHTVPALEMLNDDGMSSDEEDVEDVVLHYIHTHPWRSEAATTLIRAIDDALRDDRKYSSNRKSRPNIRRFAAEHCQSKRETAIPFRATALLPENFYNWEVLRKRQDFTSQNVDPTDIYHPTQARPELFAFRRPTLQRTTE